MADAAAPWAAQTAPVCGRPKDEVNASGDDGEREALEMIHARLAERTFLTAMRAVMCAILGHSRIVPGRRGGVRAFALNRRDGLDEKWFWFGLSPHPGHVLGSHRFHARRAPV